LDVRDVQTERQLALRRGAAIPVAAQIQRDAPVPLRQSLGGGPPGVREAAQAMDEGQWRRLWAAPLQVVQRIASVDDVARPHRGSEANFPLRFRACHITLQ